VKPGNSIQQKQFSLASLQQQVARWRLLGKKLVFTNGCFDILHAGHIASLTEAAQKGDVLIVGINADASVRKLKGPQRPVNDETSRALLLAALAIVDAVIIFAEDTPRDLILAIRPDTLVKGGDYKVEDIAGATEVLAWGGQVFINPIVPGFSTSGIIGKIQHTHNTAQANTGN
jgi:D-beta-D-heptose 7-phosphate kinase/D-beta-D-heptose 1-phosphate adenosyltransferase